MKLEAIVRFSGTDKENLPERIIENGVLFKNFTKTDDYGEGVWKTECFIDDEDVIGLDDIEIKELMYKAINQFLETGTYNLNLEKMTVIAKDNVKTLFKDGGKLPEVNEFAKGGKIKNDDLDFFENINLSKLPKNLQSDVKNLINVLKGNIDDVDFSKKEIQVELDNLSDDDISDEEIEETKNRVSELLKNKISEKYPDAIKKQDKKETGTKKEDKIKILETKIKGFKTALKFAKGEQKKILETKIKGFEIALKFAKK